MSGRTAGPPRGRAAALPGLRASPPLRTLSSLLPIVAVAVAVVVYYALRRRERRQWASRSISGGRKALVLNVFHRD